MRNNDAVIRPINYKEVGKLEMTKEFEPSRGSQNKKYLSNNLDNLLVLFLAGLTITSVEQDIKQMRTTLGLILVLILPGYALVNLAVDALIFKWIMGNNPLIVAIIKITEVAVGIIVTLVIVPFVGFLLNYMNLEITLIPLVYSLSFIVAVSTVMDILVRKKYRSEVWS